MKQNRKFLLGILWIFLLCTAVIVTVVLTHRERDHSTKLISILEEQRTAQVREVFPFAFDRAYVFGDLDGYLSGEGFAKYHNLDISIPQVEEGSADYIQRIVFVNEAGDFVYEFKCMMDDVYLATKGVVLYPETIIERQSAPQEKPMRIIFHSSETYGS